MAEYPPDPTVHSNPEYEKRCPYCHPKMTTAEMLARQQAHARGDAIRRQRAAAGFERYEPAPLDPAFNAQRIKGMLS